MTGILHVALAHVATAIRERVTLFWFLIFPVFLLVLLAVIFGNVGQEGEIRFEIGLVNQDTSGPALADFAAIVVETFRALAGSAQDGAEPLFSLHEPDESSDLEAFLESEQLAVRRGRRAAVVVIPPGFSASVLQTMMSGDVDAARLAVYMTDSNVASEMATEIIGQVLAEIDREILMRSGRFDPAQEIVAGTVWLGQTGEETPYIDFVLPGIILMGFFVNGLFGVPGAILFNRDRKVLRRYWVTPLSVPRFLAGFSIGHLSLCALQFVLLYLLGR
ncbi:ABC transporter permease, partial [Candidatus Bipolaricaulota bacterium]|nr:ABC transporter permease [Candidatus Bipolaricaulota bacterium]